MLSLGRQLPSKDWSSYIDGDVSFLQLRMSEIDDVELLDKRGYLTICVSLVKDGKVYLRKTEGIREWFRTIRVRSGEITTCYHRFSLNNPIHRQK